MRGTQTEEEDFIAVAFANFQCNDVMPGLAEGSDNHPGRWASLTVVQKRWGVKLFVEPVFCLHRVGHCLGVGTDRCAICQ